MANDIIDKIVVITGAAQGIGFDTAKEFLRQGANHVIILDIDEELGARATETLNSEFGKNKATFFNCNVTTDLETTFSKILDTFKTFDVLINNAGILYENCIRRTMAVNTIAPVEWTMKFWDHARKDNGGNGGTVINVSSVYGYMVDAFTPYYKCSKHAVIGFTRTIGHKINYEQTGVRVIAACPSFTRTALVANAKVNDNLVFQNDAVANFFARSKWLEPADIAEAITEMFKKADSGTVWSIIGDELLKVVTVPLEFHSEYLIKDEL